MIIFGTPWFIKGKTTRDRQQSITSAIFFTAGAPLLSHFMHNLSPVMILLSTYWKENRVNFGVPARD